MSGKASYVDAMQIGDIMRGGTIGIIEESRNEKFKKGDAVQYQGGWQEYCINDGKGLRLIPLNTGLEIAFIFKRDGNARYDCHILACLMY